METKKPLLSLILLLIPFYANALICPEVEVVSRSDWGARSPVAVTWIDIPVPHIFIWHTGTPQCESLLNCSVLMKQLQGTHMAEGYGDFAYNFVIGGDGRAYEGVGWDREGTHTPGWNSNSLGIAFMGNFTQNEPSEKMLTAARKLIVCGIKQDHFSKDRALHGARDAVCTDAPGTHLYEIIKRWPAFEAGPLEGYHCLEEKL